MEKDIFQLEPHLISKKDLASLTKSEFIEFCRYRYSGEFDVNEKIGEKIRGSFSPIHMAGWTGNIEALELLIKLDANINQKTNDEKSILDTFLDNCFTQDPQFVENVANVYRCIEILISTKEFDFNQMTNDLMTPLHRFLRFVSAYPEQYSKIPETEKIIETLISLTDLNTKELIKHYHTDYPTLLAKTGQYFNEEMIDKMMSKNQIQGEFLELIPQLMCTTERSKWKYIEKPFQYMVSKYNIPIKQSDNNIEFIDQAIRYRHKPLFDLAVKSVDHKVDLIEILKNSLTNAFKGGIYYVKRQNPQVLIDNQNMIELAANFPTKLLMEKLIITTKYEMTSQALSDKLQTNHECRKSKVKI